MANEINWRHIATGVTLYATIRTATTAQMWNTDTDGPNFETLLVANWYHASAADGNYWIALSESPASSYLYRGTFPPITGNMVAGWYWVDVFQQAGATPAIGDPIVGTLLGWWDGTAFKTRASDAVQMDGLTAKVPLTSQQTADAVWSADPDQYIIPGLMGYMLIAAMQAQATSDQLDAAIWAQTRFRMSIPERIERPESGTTTYTFGLTTYDRNGALADCASTPTVAAYTLDGDAQPGLGSIAKIPATTGIYTFTFDVPSGQAVPMYIRFQGSGSQGGETIGMTDYTIIVDDIGPDFTAVDRANLALAATRSALQASVIPAPVAYRDIETRTIKVHQGSRFGAYVFPCTGEEAGAHEFKVFNPGSTTALWTLTTAAGDIAASTTAVTVDDHAIDAHTATPGRFKFILRNSTTKSEISWGDVIIEPAP